MAFDRWSVRTRTGLPLAVWGVPPGRWISTGNHLSGERPLPLIMKFNCLIEKDEDGYFYATIPSLPGCYTQAKTYEELLKRLDEAISLYLEVNEPPEPGEHREFVGVQAVEITPC